MRLIRNFLYFVAESRFYLLRRCYTSQDAESKRILLKRVGAESRLVHKVGR